jgi:hypothetical protein
MVLSRMKLEIVWDGNELEVVPKPTKRYPRMATDAGLARVVGKIKGKYDTCPFLLTPF